MSASRTAGVNRAESREKSAETSLDRATERATALLSAGICRKTGMPTLDTAENSA